MYVTDTADDGSYRQKGRGQIMQSSTGSPVINALKLLLRCKLWMLLGAVLGGGIAAFIALNITPRYHSTAQILIDPRDLRVLQNEVTPGGIVNDSTTAYLESQARVINSDKIKLRVIESENLAQDAEFGGEPERGTQLQEFINELIGRTHAARKGDPAVMALEEMDKRVYVKRGERTFVIDVTVTSKDPVKAARIANALVTAYFKDQIDVRSETTQRTSNALTGRLVDLRNRLRDSEEKLQQFKVANDISSIGGRPVSEDQLNQGGVILGQARARTAEAKARLDQLRIVRPSMLESGSLPEAMTSGAIITLKAQLGAAMGREADLVTQLGPSHPQMIAARSQVRDARRQISDELERIVQSARIDFERAQATEKTTIQRFTDLKKDNFQNSQASVQMRELEREAEAHRSVYQAFLLRAREASELVGVDSTNARVISDAMPASRNNNLPRKLVVMIGLAIGAALGLLIGLLMGWGRSQMAMERGADDEGPFQSKAYETNKPQQVSPSFSRMTDPVRPQNSESKTRAESAVNDGANDAAVMAASANTGNDTARHKVDETKTVSGWRTTPDHTQGYSPAFSPAFSPAHNLARPVWRKGSQAPQKPARAMTLDEMAEEAGLPILARLPRTSSHHGKQNKPELRSVFQDKGLIVDALERPNSPFAKAIDDVLEALPEMSGTSTRSRRIMVVSLKAQSGASMLSLNLALAAAREDEVPLLVDLGRGAKTLTDMLANEAQLGFDDVYDGSVGFVRAALQDEETGVFFLPREKGRMLYPDEFNVAQLEKNFLSSVRRFSPVVIDGAAIGADPLLMSLAETADDVLIIGQAQSVSLESLEAVRKALGKAASRIRGLVINEG